MDPAKSMFGGWYPTFTSQDNDLNGALEELSVHHTRFFNAVGQLITADADKRQEQFAAVTRIMNQLDYEIISPIIYSEKRIAEAEAQEQLVIQDMMATFEKISGSASRSSRSYG